MAQFGEPTYVDVPETRGPLTAQEIYGRGNSVAFGLRDWQRSQGLLRGNGEMDDIYISMSRDGGKIAGVRVGGREQTKADDLRRIREKAEQMAQESETSFRIKHLGGDVTPTEYNEFPEDMATGDGIFYLTQEAIERVSKK